MQIVLQIWSVGKKQALRSSAAIFCSFLCWNFVFISSCKPNSKPAFTQPHPAQSQEGTNFQSADLLLLSLSSCGLGFSGHIRGFLMLWHHWCWGDPWPWVSSSCISLSSSSLGCLWQGGHGTIMFYNPIRTLSHWCTLFSSILVISIFHHVCLHRRVGILWSVRAGSLHVLSFTYSKAGVVGPMVPLSFPHSFYSGNSGNFVERPL